MIYQLYQHQSDILDPLRWMARSSSAVFGHPWPGIGTGAVARRLSAALEKVHGGDTAAFARPMYDSYHDIWMELHQDLLLTSGHQRGAGDE